MPTRRPRRRRRRSRRHPPATARTLSTGLATLIALAALLYTLPWRRAARGAEPGSKAAMRGFNVLWRGRAALSALSALWAVSGGGGWATRVPLLVGRPCSQPRHGCTGAHRPCSHCRPPRPRPARAPAALPAAAREQPVGRQLASVWAQRHGLDGRRLDVPVCPGGGGCQGGSLAGCSS